MNPQEALFWALEVLNLPCFSTKEELKEAYYTCAKKVHPDFGGSDEMMADINNAYEILKHYMDDFRFTFSDEEIAKQFPETLHVNKFRF